MATIRSRISELASLVAINTETVSNYLQLPPEIEASRVAVLEASQELNDLLQKPRDYLFNHQHITLLYLKLISRFHLASVVPTDGDISYATLAEKVGLQQAALIADDAGVADWVGANVDEMWPSAGKVVDALMRWPQAAEPNQTGFNLAHGIDDSFYTTLGKDQSRACRFGGAMSLFTTGEGYALRHLTDAACWGTLADAASPTIVDLGGSHGDVAFALARKYPKLNIIVQELPQVVANSKEEDGLNVKFMAHDFFTPQPVKGADVYLCRWTMHNWSDEYCLRILQALIPALKPGARVIIMDFVMPPFGVLPNSVERKLRAMDVTMLEIGNAKERDIEDWKTLFSQADERFTLTGVSSPPESSLAILELKWSL